jgi:heterotetrameric sarcosine oxidase gamma subunit
MRRTLVSAAEPRSGAEPEPGFTFARCVADVLELAALREGASKLQALAADAGVRLAALGRSERTHPHLTLGVRPRRWLLLGPRASLPWATWQARSAGLGAAVDMSSALAAFHLAGPAARAVLARGCRVDLDPEAFPSGHAAATIMAQVSTIVAALPSGLLLLTPSSTARHVGDWLTSSAKPFGCVARGDVSVEDLCGDERA